MIGGLSLFSPGSIASYGSPAGFGSGQTTTLPFGVDDGRGGLCSTLECKTHGAMLKEILQARFPGLKVMGVEDGNEAAVASSSPAPAAEAATARPVATASAGLASGQTLMTAQEQGSAGNSNGAAKAPGDLSEEEKQQVAKLKQTDAKVRAHERAHAAVGGQYAGAPSYDYVRGPDGQMYAVGGEVSIDIGPENDPEATLQKAAQVAAAALAPADPSGADRAVAAAAQQLRLEALAQIREEKRVEQETEEAERAVEQAAAAERQQALGGGAPPEATAGGETAAGTTTGSDAVPQGSDTPAARAAQAYGRSTANDNSALNNLVGRLVGISA